MSFFLKDNVMRRLFFFGLIVFICSAGYDYYLTGIYLGYPQTPKAVMGEIIPYHVRSEVVYVTQRDIDMIYFVKGAELLGAAMAIAGVALRAIKRRTSGGSLGR